VSFSPAVSRAAAKRIRQEMRRSARGLISHHPASSAHQLATPDSVRPLTVPA
jgi:hypothetical protein